MKKYLLAGGVAVPILLAAKAANAVILVPAALAGIIIASIFGGAALSHIFDRPAPQAYVENYIPTDQPVVYRHHHHIPAY